MPIAMAETVSQHDRNWPRPLAIVAAALTANTEPAVRLQQLCGAVTAKAMEDCLFYRDARLVSLNEVGGEPARFGVERRGVPPARRECAPGCGRTRWSTLTTHDTKRGEDVRARIGVLSQVPSLWAELVGKWALQAPPPDPATGLFLLQNIFGVWPVDGVVTDELRERLHAYAERPSGRPRSRTTWNDPDDGVRGRGARVAGRGHRRTGRDRADRPGGPAGRHARSDALGQKLLALTAPGVPDVYQGTELWEDSLVDPDNRRPVDYAARREALATMQPSEDERRRRRRCGCARRRPASFTAGGYTPVLAAGACARSHRRLRSRRRRARRGDAGGPFGWPKRLGRKRSCRCPTANGPTGSPVDRCQGSVLAAELFADMPVALLERAR